MIAKGRGEEQDGKPDGLRRKSALWQEVRRIDRAEIPSQGMGNSSDPIRVPIGLFDQELCLR
jgi:hypothetical protein